MNFTISKFFNYAIGPLANTTNCEIVVSIQANQINISKVTSKSQYEKKNWTRLRHITKTTRIILTRW